MKELAINRSSVILTVARYGGLKDFDRTDLCTVFWALVRGVLRAPFLVAAGVAIGLIGLVLPILLFVVWAQTGHFVPLGPDLFGIGLWAGIGFAALAITIQDNPRSVPGVALVQAGYRGWKEKTCVLVAIND